MSSTENPDEEINEVRANLGKTSSSNVSNTEIDLALTGANDQVLEDTGFNTESDPPYQKPELIKKLKILNATAYLLIRFADKVELRESILKEIARNNKNITDAEIADTDEETIIDSVDYETYPLNANSGFYIPTTIRPHNRSLGSTTGGL